jgi:hypothetical protein
LDQTNYFLLILKISFQGLGIIQTKKGDMKDIVYGKMKAQFERENQRPLSDAENRHVCENLERLYKKCNVNINQVRLGYTAYVKNDLDSCLEQISPTVYSTVINNKKSPKVGDLKICRMSTCASIADGGQEVFLFVSKVDKSE